MASLCAARIDVDATAPTGSTLRPHCGAVNARWAACDGQRVRARSGQGGDHLAGYELDGAEVAARLARGREWFPRVPESEAEWRAQSFLFGSVDEVVRDLRRWQGLGVQAIMLQCLDIDDLAALELIAREVVPAVA